MSDGGIAMEDLGQEQVDEGDGVEETVPPGVFNVAAGVEDLGAVKLLGRSLPTWRQASRISGRSSCWAGACWNRRRTLTIR
jgi:hypothetical protein